MNLLLRTVELSVKQVRWFALQDAKTLAYDMEKVVKKCKAKLDKESEKELLDIANKAVTYLLYRDTPESRETCTELRRVIDEIGANHAQ